MSARAVDSEGLATAIAEAASAFGGAGMRVTALKRLSGGASKESWAFDLVTADGSTTPMVLRRQPAELRFAHVGVESLGTEAALLRIVGKASVPVPAVYFELAEGSAAGEGYAMARIDGETVGVRILKDPTLVHAREGLAHQCGEILARVHAVPLNGLPALPEKGAAQALAEVRARHVATGQQRPVFEFALRWLDANLPENPRRVLVHGDFRNGNLVVGPDGVRAVLDWELAHVGIPASDLAWLCVNSWRFQAPDKPAGGFGTRAQLLEGYRAAGGGDIAPTELHAWEVLQTLNWGVMCAEVAQTFMQGVRTVEGAMIGRRASETEFDLLRLLAPNHEAWNAG
jgi:aminoglycoside phosphotransferase (APT) family kinase protein